MESSPHSLVSPDPVHPHPHPNLNPPPSALVSRLSSSPTLTGLATCHRGGNSRQLPSGMGSWEQPCLAPTSDLSLLSPLGEPS